jgi:hypothetical protein
VGSRWRICGEGLRARLPRGASGRRIDGIIQTIVGTGEGGKDRISGMTYTAVAGRGHPLDGKEIDFGERGIERDQVPLPWREILGEPFTFGLDSPDQDAASLSCLCDVSLPIVGEVN